MGAKDNTMVEKTVNPERITLAICIRVKNARSKVVPRILAFRFEHQNCFVSRRNSTKKLRDFGMWHQVSMR